LPSEQVLRWVAGVVGGMHVVSIENASRGTNRPSGTFRLRVEGTSPGAADLILKLSVPRWITDGMVITNARALWLAEAHGLAAPRLIAADLDGSACGTVATLETFLSGSSDSPPMVSPDRLREAGAAIARVNAVVLAPRGVGDPGVDLGSLRMQMALQYGHDAPTYVLEGWQRQAGRSATSVPYWDAVAALNTPTVMHGWVPGFAGDGSPLDDAAVTERRDAFLRAALDQLPARIS
jgi:hypothetical protein